MSHLPASTTAGGMCFAFPDVCNTPSPTGTLPIPYPNLAQLPTATGTQMMVMIGNRDTVTQSSKMTRSNGDEGGVSGGVSSGVFGDQVAFRLASSKVFAGGEKVVYVSCMSAHNGSSANAPAGAQVTPSQVTVHVAM